MTKSQSSLTEMPLWTGSTLQIQFFIIGYAFKHDYISVSFIHKAALIGSYGCTPLMESCVLDNVHSDLS